MKFGAGLRLPLFYVFEVVAEHVLLGAVVAAFEGEVGVREFGSLENEAAEKVHLIAATRRKTIIIRNFLIIIFESLLRNIGYPFRE